MSAEMLDLAPQSGSDWPQMGQTGIFILDLSTDLKSGLKKSRICPFVANLAQSGPKYDIPTKTFMKTKVFSRVSRAGLTDTEMLNLGVDVFYLSFCLFQSFNLSTQSWSRVCLSVNLSTSYVFIRQIRTLILSLCLNFASVRIYLVELSSC